MSSYLQRLLARVAPTGPGLASVAAPSNLPASPLFDGDQRIGLPGFSLLDVPGEVDAVPADLSIQSGVPSDDVTDRREQPASVRPDVTAKPAPGAPLPPLDPTNSSTIDRLAPLVEPIDQTAIPVPTGQAPAPLAAPAQAASPPPMPITGLGLGIEPGDFEPAEPGELRETVIETVAEARPDLAPMLPAIEVNTEAAFAPPAQPLQVEAAPVRTPAQAIPLAAEPVPSGEATPALPHPAALAELEPGQDMREPAPSGPRPVVIDQVVIDITQPAAPPSAATDAPRDRQGASTAAPMTAEAASMIGPLPHSRPFAVLYGMRRR